MYRLRSDDRASQAGETSQTGETSQAGETSQTCPTCPKARMN